MGADSIFPRLMVAVVLLVGLPYPNAQAQPQVADQALWETRQPIVHDQPPTTPVSCAQQPGEAAAHLVHLVNAERQSRGLPTLQATDRLSAAARDRIAALTERFSDEGARDVLQALLEEFDGAWSVAGMNQARVQARTATGAAEGAHHDFMARDETSSLLLSPTVRYLGVAACLQDRQWYFVQVFAG
jgi:uncharacterized protein YkwD